MKKWPRILKNKYIFTLLLFAVWMTFFDGNSLRRQFNLYRQRGELEAAVNERKKVIESVKRSMQMRENAELRERFAREEYRFKKDNEEIFVIVTEEE